MATPPLRTALSDTYPNPSNAVMRGGMGELYDYVTGLLGATGDPAECLAILSTILSSIASTGTLSVITPVTLGYGTGAGGTVTQSTSKSTSVTLNKPCGTITMHNETLAAGAVISFVFNNSLVAASDTVLFTVKSGFGIAYNAYARAVSAGVVTVAVHNNSAGAGSNAVEINFVVIKGATA